MQRVGTLVEVSVPRDSLFGEEVIWSGRPKAIGVPALYRTIAVVCATTAAISTASAVVVARALERSPAELLLFAAWIATVGFAAEFGPRWWQSALVYDVTAHHVVVRRGRIRRTVERHAVSYARIRWHPTLPDVGDLELVRAVPTGALRRRLSIVLHGVSGPDRVWAIIRGVTPGAGAGNGQRLLTQRLEEGERVLWSGHPAPGWQNWIPLGVRGIGSVVIAALMAVAAVSASAHAIGAVARLVVAGFEVESIWFVALVASVSLTIVLLFAGAGGIAYVTLVRPARLAAATRYLVTDRRVLIQCRRDELCLDRAAVVDVIDAPGRHGLRDLFLVLDGPRARALAASGAFGEARGDALEPVLERLGDPDPVRRILAEQPEEALG